MSEKQPIIIRRGTFVGTLYDVGSLMELPLANIRKLWKIMFDAAYENEDTIAIIRAWLPRAIEQTAERLDAYKTILSGERAAAETVRSTVAAFGSTATKEQKQAVTKAQKRVKSAEGAVKTATAAQIRAHKLQTIFNDMAAKAKL